MDRTEYLYMCQKCAVLRNGRFKINQPVYDDLKVKYEEILYYPYAYKLSFDHSGKAIHTAVLHDLKTNSITECNLEKVIKYVDGRSIV